MIGPPTVRDVMLRPCQNPARLVVLAALISSLVWLPGCARPGPGYAGIDGELWHALTRELPPSSAQQADARHQSLRAQLHLFARTHPDVEAVQRIVDRLVTASFRPELEIHAHVLREPGIEAFSTGGGHLYVSRGLLIAVESESELAFALGHEVAHIHASHAERRGGRATYRTAHSRSHEAESDVLATRYIQRAGYDAIAGGRFLDRLRQGDSSWPKTHPAPPGRSENIRLASQHFRGSPIPLSDRMFGPAHRSLVTLDRLCQDAAHGRIRVASCEAAALPDVAAGPSRGQIRAVQEALGQQGYDCGVADGIMGPRTRGCIRSFQQDRGLPVTGRPGASVRDALDLEPR